MVECPAVSPTVAGVPSEARTRRALNLGGELMDQLGQFGVGMQFQLTGDEVVVGPGLVEGSLPVLPDHLDVDRRIASRETMSVKVGQGLRSNTRIHTAKTMPCRYTNLSGRRGP
jgi:hypothetical protein